MTTEYNLHPSKTSQYFCPCCSSLLLSHFRQNQLYWFCSRCHQEMPYAINNEMTDSGWIRIPSEGGNHAAKLVPINQKPNKAAANLDLLMSYVAYYVSRGKIIMSPLEGALEFDGLVYQFWGYHPQFLTFWTQLQQRRDFSELSLKGDIYCFGQFLKTSFSLGECARCHLPQPIFDNSITNALNCNLCDEAWLWEKKCFDTQISVLAIGETPENLRTEKELYQLNGLEIKFVVEPEAVTPELLEPGIDLVLIYAKVSKSMGQAWVEQLRSYAALKTVPMVALSPRAGEQLSWVDRTLGIEDYLLVPLGGKYLATLLHQWCRGSMETHTLHWFPC